MHRPRRNRRRNSHAMRTPMEHFDLILANIRRGTAFPPSLYVNETHARALRDTHPDELGSDTHRKALEDAMNEGKKNTGALIRQAVADGTIPANEETFNFPSGLDYSFVPKWDELKIIKGTKVNDRFDAHVDQLRQIAKGDLPLPDEQTQRAQGRWSFLHWRTPVPRTFEGMVLGFRNEIDSSEHLTEEERRGYWAKADAVLESYRKRKKNKQ